MIGGLLLQLFVVYPLILLIFARKSPLEFFRQVSEAMLVAFGTSSMGDFACHDMDAATWAYDLASPTRIEAHAIGPSDAEMGGH